MCTRGSSVLSGDIPPNFSLQERTHLCGSYAHPDTAQHGFLFHNILTQLSSQFLPLSSLHSIMPLLHSPAGGHLWNRTQSGLKVLDQLCAAIFLAGIVFSSSKDGDALLCFCFHFVRFLLTTPRLKHTRYFCVGPYPFSLDLWLTLGVWLALGGSSPGSSSPSPMSEGSP